MNPLKENTANGGNQNGGKPKDALDHYFEKVKQRALVSPLIKKLSQEDLKRFVEVIDYNNLYQVYTGVLVVFKDDKDYGSFYPFWLIQSCFVARKTNNPVKFLFLNKNDKKYLDDMHLKILGDNGIKPKKVVTKTQIDLEWRVPFSEADIELFDKVFQDLIRRKQK